MKMKQFLLIAFLFVGALAPAMAEEKVLEKAYMGVGYRFDADLSREAKDLPQAQYILGTVFPFFVGSLALETGLVYNDLSPSYLLFLVDSLNSAPLPNPTYQYELYDPHHFMLQWEPKVIWRYHEGSSLFNLGFMAGISGSTILQTFLKNGKREIEVVNSPLDLLLGLRGVLVVWYVEYRLYIPLQTGNPGWNDWRKATQHAWTIGALIPLGLDFEKAF